MILDKDFREFIEWLNVPDSILLVFLLLIFPFSCANAQTTQSGDIVLHVNSIISSLPGASGNDYAEPNSTQLTSWESVLSDLIAENYASAATTATTLGYDLIEFSDNTNSETYYILETTSGGSNYWGTYVYNPNACRSELIIMSPHPKKDFNTGKQGIYCFKLTDAYFYMLAGTNRCNSPSFSTCSGATTVCTGSSESYRISDMAHIVTSIWQRTTEYLHDNVSGTWFVQLHGFTKLVTDPYVIMSNGTQSTPTPDKIASLRDELLVVDNTLIFKIAHLDLTWTRLRGFFNTNGRYINSSANACTADATATNGRFLHIEQEKTKLRQDSTGWHKMAMALGEAFNAGSCASLTPLPVELIAFRAQLEGAQILIEWVTQTETNNAYFVLEKSVNGIDFGEIAVLAGRGNSLEEVHYSFLDTPFEGTNYYRLRQVDFDGTENLSPIIQVYYNAVSSNKVWMSNGRIEIEWDWENGGEFLLFNKLGQLILARKFNNNRMSLEVPKLAGGLYFFQLKTGYHKMGGKLFKSL